MSLITGAEVEIIEPVPDEVTQLLELNDRQGRLRERMVRRVVFGSTSASGEVHAP